MCSKNRKCRECGRWAYVSYTTLTFVVYCYDIHTIHKQIEARLFGEWHWTSTTRIGLVNKAWAIHTELSNDLQGTYHTLPISWGDKSFGKWNVRAVRTVRGSRGPWPTSPTHRHPAGQRHEELGEVISHVLDVFPSRTSSVCQTLYLVSVKRHRGSFDRNRPTPAGART